MKAPAATLMAPKKKKNTKDQHLSSFMVRLPEVYREQIQKSTEKTRRSITMEVRVAIEEYLAKSGLWPPKSE